MVYKVNISIEEDEIFSGVMEKEFIPLDRSQILYTDPKGSMKVAYIEYTDIVYDLNEVVLELTAKKI